MKRLTRKELLMLAEAEHVQIAQQGYEIAIAEHFERVKNPRLSFLDLCQRKRQYFYAALLTNLRQYQNKWQEYEILDLVEREQNVFTAAITAIAIIRSGAVEICAKNFKGLDNWLHETYTQEELEFIINLILDDIENMPVLVNKLFVLMRKTELQQLSNGAKIWKKLMDLGYSSQGQTSKKELIAWVQRFVFLSDTLPPQVLSVIWDLREEGKDADCMDEICTIIDNKAGTGLLSFDGLNRLSNEILLSSVPNLLKVKILNVMAKYVGRPSDCLTILEQICKITVQDHLREEVWKEVCDIMQTILKKADFNAYGMVVAYTERILRGKRDIAVGSWQIVIDPTAGEYQKKCFVQLIEAAANKKCQMDKKHHLLMSLIMRVCYLSPQERMLSEESLEKVWKQAIAEMRDAFAERENPMAAELLSSLQDFDFSKNEQACAKANEVVKLLGRSINHLVSSYGRALGDFCRTHNLQRPKMNAKLDKYFEKEDELWAILKSVQEN